MAVEHRHIHVPALSGDVPVVERRQDADDRVEPGCEIADGDAGAHRRSVRLACQAHAARQGLDDHVVGGAVPIRTVMAEAADCGCHQLRIGGQEHFVRQAEPLHHAGAEIFDQHIRPRQQRQQRFAPFRLLEIQHHAPLVAIGAVEVRAVPEDEMRRDDAGRISDARGLDLDDVGAQVAEEHRGEGTRKERREIDDDDPRQHAFCALAHCDSTVTAQAP